MGNIVTCASARPNKCERSKAPGPAQGSKRSSASADELALKTLQANQYMLAKAKARNNTAKALARSRQNTKVQVRRPDLLWEEADLVHVDGANVVVRLCNSKDELCINRQSSTIRLA